MESCMNLLHVTMMCGSQIESRVPTLDVETLIDDVMLRLFLDAVTLRLAPAVP
jgi:hypothetical protein